MANGDIIGTRLLGADDSSTAILLPNNRDIIRGWVHFAGATVDATEDLTGVFDSFNVSSVVDQGTGDYLVNWSTDFADTNYSATACCSGNTNQDANAMTGTIATTGLEIRTTVNATANDRGDIHLWAIGDQ